MTRHAYQLDPMPYCAKVRQDSILQEGQTRHGVQVPHPNRDSVKPLRRQLQHAQPRTRREVSAKAYSYMHRQCSAE